MTEWLIQHPSDRFYVGWEEGRIGWTAETNRAIHSETKEEAEQFANDIGIADWNIVECPSTEGGGFISKHEVQNPNR